MIATKTRKTKRRARVSMTTTFCQLAASANLREGQVGHDTQAEPANPQPSNGGGSGDGQKFPATHGACASPDLAATCIRLRFLQSLRVQVIRSQIVMGNRLLALARTVLSWDANMPVDDRDKIKAAAVKLVKLIDDGEEIPDELETAAGHLREHVASARLAGASYKATRKRLEGEMESLAESLPVFKTFVAPIKGMGAPGLAIIVGECGNLSDFSNPGKLWKRLGLAPDNAYAMETKFGKTAIAKPRRRRSAMFTVGDSLLKSQVRKVKDGEGEDTGERVSAGEYGQVYLDRKAYELARAPEMTKMHAHRRAQRYAEKRLIRNLWRAWRDADLPNSNLQI